MTPGISKLAILPAHAAAIAAAALRRSLSRYLRWMKKTWYLHSLFAWFKLTQT
jgi:hypothetical protein